MELLASRGHCSAAIQAGILTISERVSFAPFDEGVTTLAFAGFRSKEADVSNPACVIETAEADAAPVKGLIGGSHDGLFHVVDINLDLT